MTVTARLSVDTRGKGAVATLAFTNASAVPVFIEPYNALASPPLDADLFHIVWGRGTVVRYKGMMVKRGKPGASEYVRLEPKKPLRTAPVDLTTAYDFPSGARTYKAQYVALVTYPDRDGYWTLKSNVATFTYNK